VKKLPLLIVAGFIVALLLVWGGVLAGLNPTVQDVLRHVLPAGAVGDDDRLQQEVLRKLEENFYKPVDSEALEARAIEGLVAGLDDPYTVYMDPEQYASFMEQTSGSYSGVGMVVEMSDQAVTIVSTFKGSPAAEAGIEPGDIIVEVDGVSTEGLNLDEVVGKIKGPEGSTVVLGIYRLPAAAATTVTDADDGDQSTEEEAEEAEGREALGVSQLPPGGETISVTLTRRTIEVPVTESEMLEAGDKQVALISFFTFSDGSAAELREQVERAVVESRVDAIILDLRSNGGGLLDEAVDVASIFLDKGVVVTTEGLHSPKQTFEVTGGAYTDVPLYVLTDRFTASASEIVSGALQDEDRATLIGETTFGKGLVQSLEPLSNGGALKVTTAVYLTPDGRDINETGILPDVTAPDDAATEVDETVEAALDLIAGRPTSPR
jgi:carboxyl-terminal processing protease